MKGAMCRIILVVIRKQESHWVEIGQWEQIKVHCVNVEPGIPSRAQTWLVRPGLMEDRGKRRKIPAQKSRTSR